jgi:small GTP-binding protein
MSQYTISIVGDGGVGKSALVLSYIHGQFYEDYDPTIEDFYHKQFSIDGEIGSMDIVDTVGQNGYTTLPDGGAQ